MTTSQQWEYFDRSRRAEQKGGTIPTGVHSYDKREREEGLGGIWGSKGMRGRTPLGVGEEEGKENIGVGGWKSSSSVGVGVGGQAGAGTRG